MSNVADFSSPQFWSEAQAYTHLKRTFDLNCKQHIAIMEPWLPLIVAATDRANEIAIMREALKATINERYPYTMGVKA